MIIQIAIIIVTTIMIATITTITTYKPKGGG